MLFDSISAVIMIFILMAIGFIVSKTKWYSESAQSFISKLVLNVTLPCTIIVAFLKNFTPDMVVSYAPAFAVAAIGSVVPFLLAKLVAKLMKVNRDRRGVFVMLSSVCNCGFVGFPLTQVLFGSAGSIPSIIFFMMQNIMINAIGFYEIGADADNVVKPDRKTVLKRIFNHLLIIVLASFGAAALGLSLNMLPAFVSNTLQLIDGITAPLSLIFIGMVMGSLGLKNLKLQKDMPVIFIFRFIVAPFSMILFGYLFRLDIMTIQVFTIVAALSSMVQISIMAKTLGGKVKYAVTGIFYTTLISFASIPVYALITSSIF